MSSTRPTRVNYLNNRDLLKEIHKSKCSYCEFVDDKYNQFDYILNITDDTDHTLEDILKPAIQQEARENRANRIAQEGYRAAIAEYDGPVTSKPKLVDFRLDPASFDTEELVFRVLTYEHIPLEPERKKNPKKNADHHTRLNFIPFKHYIVRDGKPVEVGRSHSKDGEFCQTHGSMTDELAKMFLLLVERYSQRSNWRGYSYVDEMKGQSLLQLSSMGLQFEESQSNNPFAYYTQSLANAFTRVLNVEKKNQNIRDEILISRGQTPSFSKQIEHEESIRKMREDIKDDI